MRCLGEGSDEQQRVPAALVQQPQGAASGTAAWVLVGADPAAEDVHVAGLVYKAVATFLMEQQLKVRAAWAPAAGAKACIETTVSNSCCAVASVNSRCRVPISLLAHVQQQDPTARRASSGGGGGGLPLYDDAPPGGGRRGLAGVVVQRVPELSLALLQRMGCFSIDQLLGEAPLFGRLLELQGEPSSRCVRRRGAVIGSGAVLCCAVPAACSLALLLTAAAAPAARAAPAPAAALLLRSLQAGGLAAEPAG